MPNIATGTNTDAVRLKEQSSAPSPSSGYADFYAQDGAMRVVDDGGLPSVLSRTIYAATASTTVDTSTSETSLLAANTGTKTLPASTLTVGRTLIVEAEGVYGSKASTAGTLTLKVKLGSTVICTTGAITLTDNLTDRRWKLRVAITLRTTGVSGTVFGQGDAALFSAAVTHTLNEMLNTTTATIDTTASQAVDVTAQFGTSDAANTITCTNATIQVMY